MVNLTPISELEKEANKKSITEVKIDDIKVAIDTNKSCEKQVEDVVDLMATAQALNDKNTNDVIVGAKRSELLDKATAKVKTAQKQVIETETEIQKAEHEGYEGILETFGFFRHLPRWLTKFIVYLLTPFFILFGFIIGLPCGCIKILMENIESIVTRYENSNDKSKPRIKITILILLILVCLGAICLTVLGCLHII